MANYVPSDTESLRMLESAASALESTASDLESRNRELSLAVSRLISRTKKKKKPAADPQQTPVVVSWGPGIGRPLQTERTRSTRIGAVKVEGIAATGMPLVLREGVSSRRPRSFRKLEPPALTEASGPLHQELARP